ncbi:MAG: hypothetical protein WC635_11785 [Bacteriovorax sp.]|jgi:hypothetical protein
MKTAFILLGLFLVSGNILATDSSEKITVQGEEAKTIYDQLKGYTYSSGALTALLEYRITVKHDAIISCQKEETTYSGSNVVETEYTCTNL